MKYVCQHYVDVCTRVLCHDCMTEYSGKMQKSLKQSHSSEKSPSPILYPSQIPKILQTFTRSLLALFQARENVLEYIYANSPQLESQELRSIGMCEKPDGEQAAPSWFQVPLPTVLLKNWTDKALCQRVGGGSLTVWIHTDEDWSWGDLFQFNKDKAVCPSV